MTEQQSQKRGIKSEAQKTQRAREGYEPLPASQPVAGAFGEHKPDAITDQDLALKLEERNQKQQRDE